MGWIYRSERANKTGRWNEGTFFLSFFSSFPSALSVFLIQCRQPLPNFSASFQWKEGRKEGKERTKKKNPPGSVVWSDPPLHNLTNHFSFTHSHRLTDSQSQSGQHTMDAIYQPLLHLPIPTAAYLRHQSVHAPVSSSSSSSFSPRLRASFRFSQRGKPHEQLENKFILGVNML